MKKTEIKTFDKLKDMIQLHNWFNERAMEGEPNFNDKTIEEHLTMMIERIRKVLFSKNYFLNTEMREFGDLLSQEEKEYIILFLNFGIDFDYFDKEAFDRRTYTHAHFSAIFKCPEFLQNLKDYKKYHILYHRFSTISTQKLLEEKEFFNDYMNMRLEFFGPINYIFEKLKNNGAVQGAMFSRMTQLYKLLDISRILLNLEGEGGY